MKLSALLLLAAFAATAPAQDNAPVYRIQFKVHDQADPSAKVRQYTLLMNTDSKGSFRVGNKVPYLVSAQNGQYNYADIGMNIDARLSTSGSGSLSLNADLDISSLVPHPAAQPNGPNPTVSSVRVSVSARVTPGTPVIIASIDDPATLRQLEVEATVTRAN